MDLSTDELLEMLMRLGRGARRKSPDPAVLALLAPALPEEFLLRALRLAQRLPDEETRATLRRAVVGWLPTVGDGTLVQAVALLRVGGGHIPWEECAAQDLAGLALRLAKLGYLQEALAAVQAIEYEDPRRQALDAAWEIEPELIEIGAAPCYLPAESLRGYTDRDAERSKQQLPYLFLELPLEKRTRLLDTLFLALERQLPGEEALESSSKGLTLPAQVVNTGFALAEQPSVAFAPDIPLPAGRPCYFWLEVSPPLAESIETTPTPLPIKHLPRRARLQVVLFAFPGSLALTPGAEVGELQLEPDGSARVHRQPGRPPDNVPAERLERRLFFPLQTPAEEGVYSLRCNIYCQKALVQSRLVRAHVQAQPQSLPGALRSTVEYTLAHTLRPAHVARLGRHRLSLLLNDNGDGTHSLHFFGQQRVKSSATFDGHELQDLINQARGALRRVAWGDVEPWHKGKPYRYQKPRPSADLQADLVEMARRGFDFYAVIRNHIRDNARVRELREAMRRPGLVQIANIVSARYVLPAALVYDHPLAPNLERHELCPAFLQAFKEKSLEECRCFQGECPSYGHREVVCPSGFWGYRHQLGLPHSLAGESDVPLEIVYQQAPRFDLCVATNLAERADHWQELTRLAPPVVWTLADTCAQTLALFQGDPPHLFYFYCHGGTAENRPYLRVGPPDDPKITPADFVDLDFRQKNYRPLVFINGCHTTDLEPEQALEFVTAFVKEANAAGVIGTEITVFEPLARAFAVAFLQRFLAGQVVGEAVRGARLALLQQGNPLGLVYIPFVLGSLRLTGEQRA